MYAGLASDGKEVIGFALHSGLRVRTRRGILSNVCYPFLLSAIVLLFEAGGVIEAIAQWMGSSATTKLVVTFLFSMLAFAVTLLLMQCLQRAFAYNYSTSENIEIRWHDGIDASRRIWMISSRGKAPVLEEPLRVPFEPVVFSYLPGVLITRWPPRRAFSDWSKWSLLFLVVRLAMALLASGLALIGFHFIINVLRGRYYPGGAGVPAFLPSPADGFVGVTLLKTAVFYASFVSAFAYMHRVTIGLWPGHVEIAHTTWPVEHCLHVERIDLSCWTVVIELEKKVVFLVRMDNGEDLIELAFPLRWPSSLWLIPVLRSIVHALPDQHSQGAEKGAEKVSG